MKSVLILGGTGRMSTKLTELCLLKGYEVTISVRGKHKIKGDFSACKVLYFDRYDEIETKNNLNGKYFDIIFDCSGYVPQSVDWVLSCVKTNRYIFVSSFETYAHYHSGHNVCEDDLPLKGIKYSASISTEEKAWYSRGKYNAELLIADKYPDLSYAAVRIPFVMSKDDDDYNDKASSRLMKYVSAVIEKKPINSKNIDLRYNFVDNTDEANFLFFLSESNFKGVVNFASQGFVTIRDVIQYVERKTGETAILDHQAALYPFTAHTEVTMNLDRCLSLGYTPLKLDDWLYKKLDKYIDHLRQPKENRIIINIFGSCVTREIFNYDKEAFLKYKISKYVNLCDFAVLDEPIPVKLDYDTFMALDLGKMPNFRKRCFYFDLTKKGIDYIKEEKAKYLIVDFGTLRCGSFLLGNTHIMALPDRVEEIKKMHDYGIIPDKMYDEFCRVGEIRDDDLLRQSCIDLVGELLKSYSDTEIILIETRNALLYDTDMDNEKSEIAPFGKQNVIIKKSEYMDTAFSVFKDMMPNAHIIPMPEFVVADKNHPLGHYPLHYTREYYIYAYNCLDVINLQLPPKIEADTIARLCVKCSSEYYEKYYKRVVASFFNAKHKRVLLEENSEFFKSAAGDSMSERKLDTLIQELKEKKVAVLNKDCDVGKYCLALFINEKIEIVFKSGKKTLGSLTEKELEKCGRSDIVINCDVHGLKPETVNGISTVMINDLLEQKLD